MPFRNSTVLFDCGSFYFAGGSVWRFVSVAVKWRVTPFSTVGVEHVSSVSWCFDLGGG